MIEFIMSGGQTGADRGGLDAAIELGIPHGGWCPRGRKADDGKIPAFYELQETSSEKYLSRTMKNVQDSDGTVIFVPTAMVTPGSSVTLSVCRRLYKPVLCVRRVLSWDFDESSLIRDFLDFVAEHKIRTLNVAGSREPKRSKNKDLQQAVTGFLVEALRGR